MSHLRFSPFRLVFLLTLLFSAGFLGGCGSSNSGGGTPPPPPPPPPASNTPFWAQWGFSPQHGGDVPVAAQGLNTQLADIVYDPFVAKEQAEFGGDLVAHYPSTLIDGNDFYIEMKTGTYVSCSPPESWTGGAACGPNTWDLQIWNVARYNWQSGKPVQIWQFASDWKPEPNGQFPGGLGGWEPVFHPVLANSVIYAPGAGGTLWKIDKTTGKSLAQIDPFGGVGIDAKNTFVAGPLAADANGNIFYSVIELDNVSDPWLGADVKGAWLVKVTPAGTTSVATYSSLVPGAPLATAMTCPGRFSSEALPWPPTPTATPSTQFCGSQRPGVNIGPAIAADGTIYTVSRAHYDERAGYLLAVNSDLSPKWQATLQHRLNDGCGVIVPIATDTSTPNTCRPGTTPFVDPTTNDFGSGSVVDQASSSPTVLPDGSILFGAITNYNGERGHMFKFGSAGNFLGSFDFGWDSTPAVYPHGGTYSIVVKDNHYQTSGLYCHQGPPICQALPPGPYYITQLDANLNVEWQFQNTTIDANHPNGYEWCINAPAVDLAGVVYVNSEDGNLYSLPLGHSGIFTTPQQQKFLKLAIGAAYTPLSIGADGRIYTQNDGHLLIVGN